MKYLLGVLALVAITIILLMRGPGTSVPPPTDSQTEEEQPSPVATNREHPQPGRSLPSKEKPSEMLKEDILVPSLEGIVTSLEDGKPVSGVTIMACHGDSQGSIDATTSEEGKYTMYSLTPGLYGVCVQGDDMMGEGSVVVVPGRTARCDLRITSRSLVKGSVKDEQGKPIHGATIAAGSRYYQMTSSDENGNYEIKIFEQFNLFTASAPLFEEGRKWIEGKPGRVDFVLRKKKRREINVFGSVRSADGKEIPGVAVRIDVDNDRASWSNLDGTIHKYAKFASATSDSSGAYRIHVILWGEAAIAAVSSKEYYREFPLTDGDNHIRHDITLPWAGGVTTVVGRVVDATSGEPVEKAIMRELTFSLWDEGGSEPDKDFPGNTLVEIRGEKRGVNIRIEAENYSRHETTVFHDPDNPRRIDLGLIRLYPMAIVDITVKDEFGNPVSTTVRFIDPSDTTQEITAYTREGMQCDIEMRSTLAQIIVVAEATNCEPYQQNMLLRAGANNVLNITLKQRAQRTYVITVTDSAGKPVTEAVIGYAPDGTAVTGADGTARITAFPGAGMIVANGYLARSFNLPEDRESIMIVLESPGVIVGKVVTEDGSPLPGAIVFVVGEPSPSGATDAQGQFELHRLSPATTYKLWASHPYHDLRSETVADVAPGSPEVTLIVRKRTYGELVIQFIDGHPPEGAEVAYTLDKARKEHVNTFILSRNEYSTVVGGRTINLGKVDPDEYDVTLSADGYAEKTISGVRVSTGQPTVVHVTFERGMTVAGKVADKDGNPVAGALVSAGKVKDCSSLDGSFTLKHIPSLTTDISVTRGNRGQIVDLTGRDPSNLQIVLE